MKNLKWYLLLVFFLIVTSVLLYLLQVFAFNKIEDTLFYLLQDLAFVPIQVFLVMIIIDKLLQRKEKQSMIEKLNMVIGVFFNEIGNSLISRFIELDRNIVVLKKEMLISGTWNKLLFSDKKRFIASFKSDIVVTAESLRKLNVFLKNKRMEMLRLLENPNLLEHDRFTDLLWAVFHLTDELIHRDNFEDLPESDVEHLKGDINRVYVLLIAHWLEYMEHLKDSYPYLYSLSVRLNPFKDKIEARIF